MGNGEWGLTLHPPSPCPSPQCLGAAEQGCRTSHQHARISLLASLWRELIHGDNALRIPLIHPPSRKCSPGVPVCCHWHFDLRSWRSFGSGGAKLLLVSLLLELLCPWFPPPWQHLQCPGGMPCSARAVPQLPGTSWGQTQSPAGVAARSQRPWGCQHTPFYL